MPAVSDNTGSDNTGSDNTGSESDLPTLPKTWRPIGVRLASVFFFAILIIVCAAAWVGFDPETRARFTIPQRATLVGFGVLIGLIFYALSRSKLEARVDGVRVVNGFRTRDLEWAEIIAIRLMAGAPWATLDLTDGTTLSVMAVQGADGPRAVHAVREFRALVSAREPGEGTPA